jgi:hypothetical protein
MTYMQAECLMKQGQLKECQKIIEHLLEHPMATESAGLGVRARQMLAAVCHGQGQLATAVEHAKQAVELSEQLPQGLNAHHRCAPRADRRTGRERRLDEAWKYCMANDEHMDEHSMSQLAGEVAWVIGNVAFMRHDYTEGHQAPRARSQAPLPRQRHRAVGPVQQGVRRRPALLRNCGAGDPVRH